MPESTEPSLDIARYADGTTKYRGFQLDGEMHGAWTWYRTDGSVMRTGQFDRGRQVGVWRTFDRSGRVVKETPYADRDFTAALAAIRAAPLDHGRLDEIVRRPAVDARETLQEARLDPAFGLEGDGWLARDSRRTADGSVDPRSQLTVISTRVLRAIEPDPDRWALAGDQLLVDLDLRVETLPAGARLAIGDAVIEVSDKPHTGCSKFSARFGSDALRWINSPLGRDHRMRGLNAQVIRPGTVRVGASIDRV